MENKLRNIPENEFGTINLVLEKILTVRCRAIIKQPITDELFW